jgi:formylmethanofuran dehydrogenase subunit A
MGADADITIYTPHENKETMFSLPRFVIKSGIILCEEGDIREEHYGKLLHVAPGYDPSSEAHIGQWFEDCYSIRFRNYPVGNEYSHEAQQVACG